MMRLLNLTPYAVPVCAGLFALAHLLRWSSVEAAAGLLLLPLIAALTYRVLLGSLGLSD